MQLLTNPPSFPFGSFRIALGSNYGSGAGLSFPIIASSTTEVIWIFLSFSFLEMEAKHFGGRTVL